MQGVGFGTIVRLLEAGVGVVQRTQADLLTGETQADADAVLELEGGAQFVALQLGAGEGSHADTRFDVGTHALPGELVDEYRREGQAVVARRVVAIPVGITQVPVAGQAANAALEPALVPVPLCTQAVHHGRIPTLADGGGDIRCLCSPHHSQRQRRACS